jgi:NADPH:quinone reductase-like Zn-dependent oxidoreductase
MEQRGHLRRVRGVDEALLARIPEDLSFEEAAAFPASALIALMNLRGQGRVRAGHRQRRHRRWAERARATSVLADAGWGDSAAGSAGR